MLKINIQIDNISRIFFVVSTAITSIESVLLVIARGKLPPQVPLYYSLPWGEGRLANPHDLWWLPVICLAVILVNLSISVFLRQLVLTRILSSATLVVTILAVITLGKIIMLETL